jgi:hypothetical protein
MAVANVRHCQFSRLLMTIIFSSSRGEGEIFCQLIARFNVPELVKYFYFLHAVVAFACTWFLASGKQPFFATMMILWIEIFVLIAKVFPAQIGASRFAAANRSPSVYVVAEGLLNFGLICVLLVIVSSNTGQAGVLSGLSIFLCAALASAYAWLIRDVKLIGI